MLCGSRARGEISPCKVLDCWGSTDHRIRSHRTGAHLRAAASLDFRDRAFRNAVFRAPHPVFDLPIFLLRLPNLDVHAIFQIDGVGAGKGDSEGEHTDRKDGFNVEHGD